MCVLLLKTLVKSFVDVWKRRRYVAFANTDVRISSLKEAIGEVLRPLPLRRAKPLLLDGCWSVTTLGQFRRCHRSFTDRCAVSAVWITRVELAPGPYSSKARATDETSFSLVFTVRTRTELVRRAASSLTT